MEESLMSHFKQILDSENVTGCVLADSQASSNVKPESAGLVSAISQHALRIDGENSNPVICLESNNRKCLIQREDNVTTAVFMNKISS